MVNIPFFDENFNQSLRKIGIDFSILFGFIFLSILLGRYIPQLFRWGVLRIFGGQARDGYDAIVTPIEGIIRFTGTVVLLATCLPLIQQYEVLYKFLDFLAILAVITCTAWLFSRLFRQVLHVYGIEFIQKLGLEADEMLLVLETIVNVCIGFIAVLTFAQSQNINLIGLLAGVGIGGIAIAFAAQKTLEQLIGTLVLYLDRPFVPGEYIRVNFNIQAEDVFARVESIGLRSTKLRTVAKSTLLIVPNSILASKDIENISRGKKVMVLLYMDFASNLDASQQALVEQVVKDSTNALFGIDPGSTKVALYPHEGMPGTRARVTFFILGSNENSIDLRKRLLELANENVSKILTNYGIDFTVQEPTIYVDSPVTI